MKHIALLLSGLAVSACDMVAVNPAPQTIPAALQGRWGLVAGDCISGASDAKGLMTVSQTTLAFYESRATLGAVAARSEAAISAQFAFSGEGQTWTRNMTLQLNGSDRLVRSESDPDGIGAPLTYTRCP